MMTDPTIRTRTGSGKTQTLFELVCRHHSDAAMIEWLDPKNGSTDMGTEETDSPTEER
jgi:hypothetical protein